MNKGGKMMNTPQKKIDSLTGGLKQ